MSEAYRDAAVPQVWHDIGMGDQAELGDKLTRVPIGFPTDLYEWLREFAFRRRTTMAEVVREAVRDYRVRAEPQLGLPLNGKD